MIKLIKMRWKHKKKEYRIKRIILVIFAFVEEKYKVIRLKRFLKMIIED